MSVAGVNPRVDELDRDGLDWRWRRFDALMPVELQNIYAARQQVFSIEQQCLYVDADGCDEHGYQLAAWRAGMRLPLASARVLDPGVRYAEASIGRVITDRSVRATGLGRELMRRAIAHAEAAWPGTGIRISAQSHLERFYRGFGFIVVGVPYIEDGTPHIEMLRTG